jgi:hypothetical protein
MPLAAVEAMACKHFLRSPRGHLRKDRSPAGQSHIGRPRQVENVITVQEHREHVRTADDANAAVWRPESQGLLERSTRRVPEQRSFDGSAAMAGTCRVRVNRRRKYEHGCRS